MRFLIVGDLHGNKPKIYFKNFDAIIAPGDFCSDKEIKPIYKKFFKYIKGNPESKIGFDEFSLKMYSEKELDKMEKRSLEEGRKILEFLNSWGKPVFIVPGNWDQSYGESRIKDIEKSDYNYSKHALDFYLGGNTNQKLTKGLKNIKDCQYKLYEFNGINIIGYGLSSNQEKPNKKKSQDRRYSKKEIWKLEKSYKKIVDKLENEYRKRDIRLPTIFITHNVPYGTKLDIIKDEDSVANKKHFGSVVAGDFCKKHQPLLCVGSHIHEGFGKDKIGKTICINSGFGSYVNTLVEIDEKKKNVAKIIFKKR